VTCHRRAPERTRREAKNSSDTQSRNSRWRRQERTQADELRTSFSLGNRALQRHKRSSVVNSASSGSAVVRRSAWNDRPSGQRAESRGEQDESQCARTHIVHLRRIYTYIRTYTFVHTQLIRIYTYTHTHTHTYVYMYRSDTRHHIPTDCLIARESTWCGWLGSDFGLLT
jgi:hypothetical protein